MPPSEELRPVKEACRNILIESSKERYALVAQCRPTSAASKEIFERQRSKILSVQVLFYEKLLTFVVMFGVAPEGRCGDAPDKLDGCLFPDKTLVTALKNTYIREAGGDPPRTSQILLDLMVKNSLLAWQILKAIGDEEIEQSCE